MTDTTNCCESQEVQLLLPNKTFWFAIVHGGCCASDCSYFKLDGIEDRCALFERRVSHGRCIPCHEAAARYEGYNMAKTEAAQ